MEKKRIQILYKKKIDLLYKLNESYYDRNNPLSPDYKYDELKKEIVNLEKKYNFLKSEKSPTLSVGHKPSKNFKKVNHKIPMLSLSNAFSEEDLINFEKNKKLFINT